MSPGFIIYNAMTWLDIAAILLLAGSAMATGWIIEHPPARRPSVNSMMADYRREWMRQMVLRDNRIADTQILVSLRQGTSFFVSTTTIAIGGVLALAGDPTPIVGVAEELTLQDEPLLFWQFKLIVVAAFMLAAFLRFVWSHRLFGYCSVLFGTVPQDPGDPVAAPRAAQAAEINIRAAINFNRGLRAIYYALAAMSWLIGSLPLIVTTLAVTAVLLTREFNSESRNIIMSGGT